MEAHTMNGTQERAETAPRRSDHSAAELVTALSEQTTRLVRQEMELARAELTQKATRAGIGAGLFGGAGMFAVYAVGALTAAAILGLSHAVTSWLAALIVGAVLLLVAGVAALVGKGQISQAVPPVPEQTVATVREDVEMARDRARQGRA